MTTSERGMISEAVDRNVVTSPIVLSCPTRGEYAPTEQSFPFSIPFPSYVSGGTSSLPPSYACWSPTFSCEVEYCVRVDVHRKGLRRHEMWVFFISLTHASLTRPRRRILPVLYLPKTFPSHPGPTRQATFFSLSDEAMYKTDTLQPVWPLDVGPKVKSTSPIVKASFTDTHIYTLPCSPNSSCPTHLGPHTLQDNPFP